MARGDKCVPAPWVNPTTLTLKFMLKKCSGMNQAIDVYVYIIHGKQWPGSLQSADDDKGREGGEQFGSGSTGGSNVDRTWVLGLQIDSIPFNSMVHLYHQLF